MGVPTLEVGYTSATTGRGDHEVQNGHVVALGKKYIEVLSYVRQVLSNVKEVLRLRLQTRR
jgi:hypothetical protein